MTTNYDDWKTHDTQRELAEDCAEGRHAIDPHQGMCRVCGYEDPNFDPDRIAEERAERLRDDRESLFG